MQNSRITLVTCLLVFFNSFVSAQSLKDRAGVMLSKGRASVEKGRDAVEKGKDTIEKGKKAIDGMGGKSQREQPSQQPASTKTTRPASTYQQGGASVSSFHPKYKVTVDSCVGERNTQVVTIFFRVQQNDAHQLMSIQVSDNRTQAYDSQGTSRKAQLGTIAGSSARYTVQERIPTDMDVPCSIQFSNIIDSRNAVLKHVFIYCQSVDANGGSNGIWGEIEIKNLPINWK